MTSSQETERCLFIQSRSPHRAHMRANLSRQTGEAHDVKCKFSTVFSCTYAKWTTVLTLQLTLFSVSFKSALAGSNKNSPRHRDQIQPQWCIITGNRSYLSHTITHPPADHCDIQLVYSSKQPVYNYSSSKLWCVVSGKILQYYNINDITHIFSSVLWHC